MAAGRFADAAAIYADLVDRLPDEPGLLMNLGMALAMDGREQAAIAPLERAVKLRPSLLPAWMFLGSSHLALGQPGRAVEPFERLVAARPDDAESRERLAQAFLASGRPGDAATHLRRLTTLAPKAPHAWYWLGQAYNAVAQEALATFERDPEDSPWRLLLVADALAADDRFAEAFVRYREAMARLPAMPGVHDAVARVYEKAGHPEWAAAERRRAGTAAIDCTGRKAECEFRAGRFQSALAATEGGSEPAARYWRVRAATELALSAFARLEKLPPSQERHELRAEMARADGRHADSVEELRAALKFAPGDPRLIEELATSMYLAHDLDGALTLLGGQKRVLAQSAQAMFVYGDALLQRQTLDEAIAWLKRALERDPRFDQAAESLGRAYVLRGDFAEAIPLLERVLDGDEDGRVHFQLATAYQRTGAAEKAKPLLERYQELQQASEARRGRSEETPAITPP